jgi:hydroxymethylpyrimidine/phosphomethylpyrimidine kinase
MIPRILIIAGSDSGGGAGIQADIKTVTMLGGHAMTAVTAITAQNTMGVQRVMPVPADIVIAQIDSVVRDIGVDAIKIGMIGSAETANAVADYLATCSPSPSGEGLGWGLSADASDHGASPPPLPPLKGRGLTVPIVFDPVMIATSGDRLADADAIAAFERLIRLATIVTPNVPELAGLIGRNCDSEIEGRIAAQDLADDFSCAVLAKGGHRNPADTPQTMLMPGGEITNNLITDWLLIPPSEWRSWTNPRLDTQHTHGTGCTLASAIATGLGAGLPLADAVERAIAYVRAALANAPGLGAGHGPMGHALGTTPFDLVEMGHA